MTIAAMRARSYPGSEVTIEQTLSPGSNYERYLASYRSDGLKIYALLTVPRGTPPATGWPVIIFNHGYIPPQEYSPTERYVAYVDALARAGYIVFRPDYRGNGQSEGTPGSPYTSPGYTVDVLNALASMQRYPQADPQRIGMWGHSMGGFLTLRAMVISKDIKAGVIWGGVVAPYADLISKWRPTPVERPTFPAGGGWNTLTGPFGSPQENPQFWDSISANAYLQDISGPLQLHHATGDTTVPWAFSQTLYEEMQAVGKPVEFYSYQGDNHNISENFGLAMTRTIAFFNRYLKP
jgi:dipeptidyl aminopeptidase/acylaminoacyl peptidase